MSEDRVGRVSFEISVGGFVRVVSGGYWRHDPSALGVWFVVGDWFVEGYVADSGLFVDWLWNEGR